MRGETPKFKRCCFCIPLRRGLIGWGYAKLALNILTIAYLILIACVTPKQYIGVKGVVILSVACAVLLIDFGFNALFVVGGHMKSVKLLKISYIYNIVSLCLILLGHCLKLYMNLRFLYVMWQYGLRMYYVFDLLVSSSLAFFVIFVQIYFILLIRSEMIKLKHESLEMQFSNHLASGEPQCTVHVTDTKQCTVHVTDTKQCTEKKTNIDGCCNCCMDKQSAVTNIVSS